MIHEIFHQTAAGKRWQKCLELDLKQNEGRRDGSGDSDGDSGKYRSRVGGHIGGRREEGRGHVDKDRGKLSKILKFKKNLRDIDKERNVKICGLKD